MQTRSQTRKLLLLAHTFEIPVSTRVESSKVDSSNMRNTKMQTRSQSRKLLENDTFVSTLIDLSPVDSSPVDSSKNQRKKNKENNNISIVIEEVNDQVIDSVTKRVLPESININAPINCALYMPKYIQKPLYDVDIDFDEASEAWRSNKISIGNGQYKYKKRKN
jgi:hypothetical protein